MNKNTSVTMAAGMTVAWILTLAALTMAIQHQAFAREVTGANGGTGQNGPYGGIGIGGNTSIINGKNGTSANGIGSTSGSGD